MSTIKESKGARDAHTPYGGEVKYQEEGARFGSARAGPTVLFGSDCHPCTQNTGQQNLQVSIVCDNSLFFLLSW